MNNKGIRNNALVSIIVPIYNTEKTYMKKCIDSIIDQTYKELEIILVDDGSTDDSITLINEYLKKDSRIKLTQHKINMGLFQARITGVNNSHGKYFLFVDSDDSISCDWVRTLVNQAEKSCSDIVIGEFCLEFENGQRDYYNLDPFRVSDIEYKGKECFEKFIEQEGRSFSWHVVWNKIYSKQLYELCKEKFYNFSKLHGHMLMWEDVVFSSGFWSKAKKITNVHGVSYFYSKNSFSATAINENYKIKNFKYIADSFSAMCFMKDVVLEDNYSEINYSHYTNWNMRCINILYNDLVKGKMSQLYIDEINRVFSIKEKPSFFSSNEENYFYHISTRIDQAFVELENIKKIISSENINIISFDIFDTLVQRPFLSPTDLFNLLSDKFNTIFNTSSYVNFANLRISAENQCRQIKKTFTPSVEEITLDEIYDYLSTHLNISKQKIDLVKNAEIELEQNFCKIRNSGKDLFELAKYLNKKIILCSDMYLSLNVIKKILNNGGYTGYEQLYLSSEIKYTKESGKLFEYISNDLGIKNDENASILHIGDNWHSDVEMPRRAGWTSCYLPKASLVFKSEDNNFYGGSLYKKVLSNEYNNIDTFWSIHDFLGLSSIYGLIANKIYDNPYISYNRDSDFNSNPFNIGYVALGPHLLSVCKWIKDNLDYSTFKANSTIHFVARDGYLVKKAFDILYKGEIKTNYLRLSRKSLLLADITDISDLYSIWCKLNYEELSPAKLEKYLYPILVKDKLDSFHRQLNNLGFIFDRTFKSIEEGNTLLKLYIDNVININLLSSYKKLLNEYFSTIISKGDVIFDIGYAGRPETALSSCLGFPINSFYIHINKDLANKRQSMYNCSCKTFYNYKPVITGVIREHLFMELGPSTIGYEKQKDQIIPIFEKISFNYTVKFATLEVQKAALKFVEDFKTTFNNEFENIIYRNQDVSVPYEYYLHNSCPLDRELFSTLSFEDDLSSSNDINVLRFWNNEINNRINKICNNILPIVPSIHPNLKDIYPDGFFVKFYNKMNCYFPKSSRRRELIKKIISIFFKK